jgi:hypothetical protein
LQRLRSMVERSSTEAGKIENEFESLAITCALLQQRLDGVLNPL